GFSDPDLSRLSRDLTLGTPEIGPPAQQIRGDAGCHPGRCLEDRLAVQLGPRTQLGLQIAGRGAQQNTEGVGGLPEDDLQGGDRRAGLFQDGSCLLYVQVCPRSDLEALFGEGQDALLNLDVVARDFDALLGNAILY